MTANHEPSVLCFDATGTLIELRESVGEIYHRVALEYDVDLPAWRLDDAFKRVLKHAPPLGTEGDSVDARRAGEQAWWSERIRQTFQAADSTVRFADFTAFSAALFSAFADPTRWQVLPDIPNLLTELRGRGHRTCIISNFDHRLHTLLEGLDLKEFFELILLPAQVGAAKPERAVFDAAADHFHVPIEGLTYIGDDSPEAMRTIRDHGPRVLDIRILLESPSLPNPIEGAATL